jgi:hypothetical protein
MSDRNPKFAEQLASARPTTRHLVTSILLDAWPNHAAAVDFGIDTQKQYEALYFPIRQGEITPETLDAALGDGPKLTALAREAASNPHKDVEFHTSWDLILGRDRSRTAEKIGLKELRSDNAKARDPDREVNQEHHRGDLER